MSRIYYIAALVIAGEMIFGLPFHTARFFRPTFLDVFGFSNTQLGDIFAVYGVTAMLSYFPGGALADRFPARDLIIASLLTTALGGLYMATIPDAAQMMVLYGYLGITTIFLFWGALIRSTREWGGTSSQGKAFGVLEGGRGLAAATFAAFAVLVFAGFLPDDPALASDVERRAGLRTVILLYSAATVAAAVLVWLVVPRQTGPLSGRAMPLANMAKVLRRPVVWAQASVVVCAYSCYKGLDNYSLYAVQVMGMNEVEAARLATIGAYTRPVAALAAGLLADRFQASRTIGWIFVLILFTYLPLAMLGPDEASILFLYANLLISFFAVFALRGVYFALLEEMRTPREMTGVTVGLVSFVGFSPEIFFAPVTGRLLDATPGVGGHLDYFGFLAAIAVCGLLVVGWLLWLKSKDK